MQPQQSFDAYARSYDAEVNSSLAFTGLKVDYFTRVKAGFVLDLVQARLGPPGEMRLLDVGCGVGNFHPLLSDHFAAINGVDVSDACLDQARAHNPAVDYRAYDGERLPHDDASFDVAMTICVMHHVPPAQWPAFAGEMKRVLRPGGLALVFEHNPMNPLTRRVVSNCAFDADAVLLRAGKTRELLSTAGLTPVESRSILSVPSIGATTRRIDRALGLLGLGAQYYVAARA